MTEKVQIQVAVDYLFPIPFMRMNIRDQITVEILEEINNMLKQTDNLNNFNQTVFNNMMTNDANILAGTLLGQVIQEHLDSYTTNVLGEDPDIKITTSWLNYNTKDAGHHKHPHPNSKVSGCFYIKTNEKTGRFNLFKPRAIEENFYNSKNLYNEFTYSKIWYQPEIYDLYMFPSFIEHSVDKNESDEPRISLAFNSFYNKTFGDDSYNKVFLKE